MNDFTAQERVLLTYFAVNHPSLPLMTEEEQNLLISFVRDGRELAELNVSELLISEYIGRQLKNGSSTTLAVIGDEYMNRMFLL